MKCTPVEKEFCPILSGECPPFIDISNLAESSRFFKCAYKIRLIKMVDITTIEETIKCVAAFDYCVSDYSFICVPYIPTASQSKYEA